MKHILAISVICTLLCISQTTLLNSQDTQTILGTTATGAILGGALGGRTGALAGTIGGLAAGTTINAARKNREKSVRRYSTRDLRSELRDLEDRRNEIQEELQHVKNAKRRQRLENELDDVTHDIRDVRSKLRRG